MNKKLLIFFFVYIVIEGALRKWFLPEYNNLLFLFKDIILILVFIFLLFNKKDIKIAYSYLPSNNKNLWVTLIIFLFFYGIIINFDSLTIIGWRYYLVSLPLIILIPLYFSKDLEKYSYYYLLLSIPVLLLGIYQYFSPMDALINRYAWTSTADKIAMLTDNRVRITGTFSYISPYTIYLQTIFLLGWLLLLRARTKTRVFAVGAIIFLTFINLIMTGSRGPVLLSAILSLPFIYYYLTKAKFKFSLIILIFGFIFFSFNLLIDPFSAFSHRSEKAGDTEIRIAGALLSPITTITTSNFIGAGVGKTFLGTVELSQKNPDTVFDEINQDRVGLELGIIGYLLVLFIKIYFLIKTFYLIKKVNNYEIKLWLWFSLTIQSSSIWSVPFYNSIAATFYFTAIGIYYLMKRKEKELSKQKLAIQN